MSFSGAVQWWDEWQLRVLVMGSLLVQYSLFFSSASRKFHIRGWFRFFIWLSYLGSDALTIYALALATLFNRQKQPSPSTSSTASAHGSSGSHGLEVMWAPILLIHLVGQDPITAYNIEDNELWTGHIITVVVQVTVAVCVFRNRKSWSGEKRLLQAAILLFVAAFLKGSEEPWALNRASIHNLVSSSSNKNEQQGEGEDDQEQGGSRRDLTLQAYVRECCATMVGGTSQDEAHSQKSQEEALEEALPHLPLEPRELFIDLALPYSRRLRILQSLMPLDGTRVDRVLQAGLSNTFDLLYTKEKVFQTFYGKIVRIGIMIINFAAVGLFSSCHKHGYNKNDVTATYILFGGTVALEILAFSRMAILENGDVPRSRRIMEEPRGPRRRLLDAVQEAFWKPIHKYIESCGSSKVRQLLLQCFGPINQSELEDWVKKPRWSGMVAQYNLLDFFSRNTSPNVLMKATRFLGCKDYLDRHWYVEYYPSSRRITEVILEHVKYGWKNHIKDVTTYNGFNNRRGRLTLQREGCDKWLRWSTQKPFDESILLWHIATDLCFHSLDTPPDKESPIIRCREMSNYMIYLLVVQPEMLLAGTWQNLFTEACGELDVIFKDGKPQLDGGELAREVAKKAQDAAGTFIPEAWEVYDVLLRLGDEKMWKVIEGVWVEMLCYSASRCRGYLHAKSLGTGGEYLSYVWLLLSHMGMETLADRSQKTEEPLEDSCCKRVDISIPSRSPTGEENLSVWLLFSHMVLSSHMGMETLADRSQKPEEPLEEVVAASASTSQSQVGAPEPEISPV